MAELKEVNEQVNRLREHAAYQREAFDQNVGGSCMAEKCMLEAADLIESQAQQIAEAKEHAERHREFLSRVDEKIKLLEEKMLRIDEGSKNVLAQLSAREAEVVALREAAYTLIQFATFQLTDAEAVNKARATIDNTAPTAAAIQARWRNEVLEEAAKVCDVHAANQLAHHERAVAEQSRQDACAIRALKGQP